jgi:hypothetical protein
VSDDWKVVYDLIQDRETVDLIQNASVTKEEFGFIPEVALFGSKEWWLAVDDGRIHRYTIEGTISRVYMSGRGDWPEFEIQSNGDVSRWTRFGEQSLYAVGRRVRLEYVLQKPKNRSRPREIKQILRISISHQ